MLRDSVGVVVAVARTRPRAMPLAMITMRKSSYGFPFLSYECGALLGEGPPELHYKSLFRSYNGTHFCPKPP